MRILGPLHESAKLLALLGLGWVTPIERSGPLAAAIRRRRAPGGAPRGATEIVMAHLLDRSEPAAAAATLFRQWEVRSLEVAMQILAMTRPGRQWRPPLHLEGGEHLAAALRQGNGAILWISDFVYRLLAVPMAIRQAGFRAPVHLSRPEHGFSVSPFGVKVLNPLWCAVEDRFLSERVVIENNDAAAALDTLRACLKRNEIVSITVAETGRRTVDVPFLRGRLRLATGPAHLARTTGAPLLPIFAVRSPKGVYEITIGRALPVEDDTGPPYAAALAAYAAMLEPFVRHDPDQWNGWIALGRLVESTPAFAASFDGAGTIARELRRLGLDPAGATGAAPARSAGRILASTTLTSE